MRDETYQDTELLAAATSCPMPDCGELALTYRSAEDDKRQRREMWEFTCPRCGLEFLVMEEDLLFRSARREWFWASTCSA